MRRKILALAAIPLLLGGCKTASPSTDAPQQNAQPAVDCLEVSDGSLNAIRIGIQKVDSRNDVGRAAAIAVNSDTWFVAAEITGTGLSDTVGVWSTINDPTTSTDNAYNSVDGFAAAFSYYVQSPAYNVTSDGVDEVRACL